MSYRYSNRSSTDMGVYLTFLGITGAWWLLVLLFHAYDPFRSYLYWWNVNPIAMITANMIVLGGGIALLKMEDFNLFDTICGIVAVIGVLWGTWNMVTYDARVMIALRQETNYVPAESPIQATNMRVSSYGEAQTNFRTQNPDARFQIGNLTFVNDRWVAEYGPKGLINSIKFPTQGFYVYDPTINKNPQYVANPMTFAENGTLGNNLRVLIARRDPFAYYDKVLYANDPDNPGHYMAVVSLTKRRGMDAVPYVSNVVLIHQDGRQEWLTSFEATNDPRLVGLQIIPEWLEFKRISAYGYKHGIWDALFIHTDQIQVQKSQINEENSPPFHMRSGNEMYWVTPMSPYNTPSFIAMAWQKSNDINGPIYIWHVPNNEAYPGVDALSATIKNADGHPSGIRWLINNGGTLSGETEILEMLPVFKNGQLYFVGYAALGSNPQQTKMFVTIRAVDSVVMQNQFSIGEVNTWLAGTADLMVLSPNTVTAPTVDSGSIDLSSYTTDQLWDLLDQIMDEIRQRGSTNGTMVSPINNYSYEGDAELYKLAWKVLVEIASR